ncbi:MAG: NUDIX hydrolase [Nitrospirae bacterium]|nr:MAG: NUDIX hydrolase [Nitrospirota bacterium]
MTTRPVFEQSAGGVILHDGQCLLIRTRDLRGRTVWTFPKGRVEPREHSEQAALREVREETGWNCRIEAELPRSEYWFQRHGQRVRKTVRWYLMMPLERVGEPDMEIEEAKWVPIDEARNLLTYPSDRRLLEVAVAKRDGVAHPTSDSHHR